MKEEDLEQIEQYVARASAGPWGSKGMQVFASDKEGNRLTGGLRIGMWPSIGQAYREDDAVFVANARTDIERLITEIRRLRLLAGISDE